MRCERNGYRTIYFYSTETRTERLMTGREHGRMWAVSVGVT